MISLKASRFDFSTSNPFGIGNGSNELTFTLSELAHAAITVGHERGWRQAVGGSIGGQMELTWKLAAFLSSVEQRSYHDWRGPMDRLSRTDRMANMDPSERRSLSYHLGMTMACAWSRKALRSPWCLHLDVYGKKYGALPSVGRSRPDLIALSPDGHWTVIECKGYSAKPRKNKDPKKCPIQKAKAQAERVSLIGTKKPALRIASFAFFSKGNRSYHYRPEVVEMDVYDPPGNDENEPEVDADEMFPLPEWSQSRYLLDYYLPWAAYFENNQHVFSDEEKNEVNFKDFGISIRMHPKLLHLVRLVKDGSIAEERLFDEVLQLSERKLLDGSAGDGIEVTLDKRWHQLFKAGEHYDE